MTRTPETSAPERARSLLVVEDDPRVAAELARGLARAGFTVELAGRAEGVVRRVTEGRFAAVILDWMLPDATADVVLDALVSRRLTPVLVLTARADLATRLRAFEAGAVDYVGKPFFMEELVARIRARIDRDEGPRRVVSWGDAYVDLLARRAYVAGEAVSLTRHELDILAYLAQRAGRAVSRRQIAENALSSDAAPEPRTVDSHVSRLRRKLGAEGWVIVPVWGVGYRFDPETRPQRG